MRLPTRPGTLVPLAGGLAATAALVPGGVPALVAGLSIPLFLLGGRLRWGLAAHAAGLAVVLGVVLAGVQPYPLSLLLVATVAGIVAWDAATTALVLDRQVSPAAGTARAEVVHSGATLAVGSALAGLAFLLSLVGSRTVPAVVAIFAISGAVAALIVLDP